MGGDRSEHECTRSASPYVYIATPAPNCGVAMIVAGMDVSGDQRSGNHKFMSLVFGTQESLDAITRRLGSEQIHMNMIKNRKVQDDIICQVRFGIECIGFCMRLEKAQTIAGTKSLLGKGIGSVQERFTKLTIFSCGDAFVTVLRNSCGIMIAKCTAYASNAMPIAGTLLRMWVGNTLTGGLHTCWRMS